MSAKIYKVIFLNNTKVYEIYAKVVSSDLEMYGFVEISGITFNSNSGILVDPAEEKLKTEFAGVTKTFVPMHTIIRIDEVDKEGTAKITDVIGGTGNIHQFPVSGLNPDSAPRR